MYKDVNFQDPDKQIALILACYNEDKQTVKDLLSTPGINVNSSTNYKCFLTGPISPLLAACFRGNLEIVKMLIEKNPDYNFENDDDHNAMHIAILGQNYELIKILYQTGEYIRDKDYLSCACKYDNMRLIKLCLNLWYNLNFNHITKLCFIPDLDFRIVKFLLEIIDKQSILYNDISPLELAIRERNQNLTKLLLSHEILFFQGDLTSLGNYYVDQYLEDWEITKIWRTELDYDDPANLFVLIVCSSDGYFNLKDNGKKARFFRLAIKLPPEIQMYISNLVYENKGLFISTTRVENELEKILF